MDTFSKSDPLVALYVKNLDTGNSRNMLFVHDLHCARTCSIVSYDCRNLGVLGPTDREKN